MEFKDYYQALGVSRTADASEIKKAYRKLARKYHPDVSKEVDAEMRMKEVNEANEVLSDAEKRAAYDRLGSGHQGERDFRPPPNWDSGFEFSGGNGQDFQSERFSDFFESLFGNAARAGGGARAHAAREARGQDHHAKVVIDLADTYTGATRAITLSAARLDESGQVVTDTRTLNVKIPKGVKEGQHIRLAGQGGKQAGGAGDLFLEIHFSPNPRYRIDGRDVIEQLPLAPWEAALGETIAVSTPSGMVEVKVPPASQVGQKLRLKGRGIPGEPAGDLYLELNVVVPAANTETARELYRSMAREMAFDPRSTHQ